MRIAFRVDASLQMGTGHVMRCLALADALRQRGALIRFVSRELPSHLCDMLSVRGMGFVPLDTNVLRETFGDLAHSNWLGTSQARDARDTAQALSDQTWDWLIVDHYALDARWESAMRSSAVKIMVIDDLADRTHDCDVLLDQNYYSDMQTRYDGKVPERCRLLLGPHYALLREEFHKLREQAKPRTGKIKRILVFFGGIDADNCTSLAMEALRGLEIKDVAVDVVIGAQHPFRAEIGEACTTAGNACHVQTSRMAELMAAADLAIGAGGSASWERGCLGLPALLVALADNQIAIAQAIDSMGAGIYLGTKEQVDVSIIRRAIENLSDKHELLEKLSQSAFSHVDGLGAERVCQELGC